MSGETVDIFGKKIFFLYPSAMIKNTIIQELVQQEYEVYVVKNHEALLRHLKQDRAAVVFININEGLDKLRWEEWVRSVLGGGGTPQICVGILTNTNDEALRNKYVTEIGVQCGFTVVKSDVSTALRQILEYLRTVGAKGRRKYLRTGREIGATINLPLNNTFVNGQVRDISAVGFSCVLDQNPILAKNALLQNIQLKLQGRILKVEGIVYGSRDDGQDRCYVFIFTQRVDSDTRVKIRESIQQYLQARMDEQLK
jgi:hypothetical protein